MKRREARALEALLAREQRPPGMRDAADFWQDFRARARMIRQDERAAARRRPALSFRLAWAAAALLLIAGGALFMWARPGDAPNRIKALEVIASHSGVIIIHDDARRGTILWVTDMQGDDSG
jgi:hypothetical protein